VSAILNVHDVFCATASRQPDAEFLFVEEQTAQAYGLVAGAIRWGEAAAKVAELRHIYSKAGYGHGHRIGLLLENRPAFLFHWFALNAIGASVVPINAEMRAAELEYLIGHSEICLAVVLPERADDLHRAASRVDIALEVASLTDDGFAPAPCCAQAPRCNQPIDELSECALLYTSGTTGLPKGCLLSNAYFLRAGAWYAQLGGICVMRGDAERIVTPLPLNHVNAMAFSTMVVLTQGGCLIQLDRFHPSRWWQCVRDTRATIVHYLGVMPAMLLAAPGSPLDHQHSVRGGFGAGVDRKNHSPFEERFGFPLVEAWAMTETGAAACIMANHEPRHIGTSCIGRAEPFVEVRLVNEQGADVSDGAPGELLVRSSGAQPRRHFFAGYLKDEIATEQAWAGGWFHTGDVVRRDALANLYFVDRKKNVIRRSGENISAVEVESVVNQHPAVKACAVAATPDDLRGDEVLACIVAMEPVTSAQREGLAASIVRHALERLAYFKVPGYVAFVDALPLTASQKIQRGQLREMAQQLPVQPHCIDTRAMKTRQPTGGG
jgi:acyl-CoA synthetase (AMP-forming)/AMP-acid ligase II